MVEQLDTIIIDGDECCPICRGKISGMPIGPIGPYCRHGHWNIGKFSKIVDGKKLHYAYVNRIG